MTLTPPSIDSAAPGSFRRRRAGWLRPLVWSLRRRAAAWTRRWMVAGADDWPYPLDRAALVVAPHQDDETFGCGGLIAAKRAAGARVAVVFLTDGRRGDGFVGGAGTDIDVVSIRSAEAAEALRCLGVAANDTFSLNLPDGGLTGLAPEQWADARARLVAILNAVRPSEVFVTHRRDGHPDHEAGYRLTRDALVDLAKEPATFEYMVWAAWLRPLGTRFGRLNGRRFRFASGKTEKKHAIAKYASQLASLPVGFARQFDQPWEVFWGEAPGAPEG